MVSVSQFIKDEGNDTQSYIKWLLQKISKLQDSGIEKHVFNCNMYHLEIDFKEKQIVIQFIFDDNEFLAISIDSFYEQLFDCY